jgi:glycosyltransferase involved in cell wall biosynthesis
MNDSINPKFNKYSIIVPSYNRQEEISDLLNSFKILDFPRDRMELIIADDGSSDQTSQIVETYQKDFPFPLNFYSQENRGPGAARNMGMEKASGDFYVFIDSDCTVPPDWLKNLDEGLHQEKADAFGGRDSSREDFSDVLKAINFSMTSFITTGGLRGKKGKKLAKFYPRSFNMGLSKELQKKIGGFGSLRHGQDIEYSHRIINSGAKVSYLHDVYVFHKRRTSIKRFFKQVFNWGIARINLYKIDSSMLELLHIAPAIATLFFLFLIIASLISRNIWDYTQWIFFTGAIILALLTLQATLRYKSWRMIYLIPVIVPIQILGYGIGFIFGFIHRVVFDKPEFVGFKRKYYQ